MDILSGRSLPAKRTRERKEVHAEKEKIQKIIRKEIRDKSGRLGHRMLYADVILCTDPGEYAGKYSEVLLDGEVIGAVADPEEVDQAFLNARAKIARETEGLVLANVECSFQRVSKLFGSTLKEEQLEPRRLERLAAEFLVDDHSFWDLPGDITW